MIRVRLGARDDDARGHEHQLQLAQPVGPGEHHVRAALHGEFRREIRSQPSGHPTTARLHPEREVRPLAEVVGVAVHGKVHDPAPLTRAELSRPADPRRAELPAVGKPHHDHAGCRRAGACHEVEPHRGRLLAARSRGHFADDARRSPREDVQLLVVLPPARHQHIVGEKVGRAEPGRA